MPSNHANAGPLIRRGLYDNLHSFAELEQRKPHGFTYRVFRLDDAVSFIHVVIEDDIEQPDSLQDVPAFQAFVADIADRCDIPPVATAATISS